MLITKVVVRVFLQKSTAFWLGSIGYARMKVQCDTEQTIEHLLKAVMSMCAADIIVQRARAKNHAPQRYTERPKRLVKNQYRAVLFDVHAASAWLLRTAS